MSVITTVYPEVTIGSLDTQCKNYAAKRAVLSERVAAFNAEIAEVKRRHITGIKSAAASAQDLQATLRSSVESAPRLFLKPRSFTFHGIKIGFTKGKGKIEWDCEDEQLVERIERMFSQDARELLIAIEKKPCKEALASLPASDLKKLGVSVESTGDCVVVKASDSEIDKMVTKMLAEGAKPIDE